MKKGLYSFYMWWIDESLYFFRWLIPAQGCSVGHLLLWREKQVGFLGWGWTLPLGRPRDSLRQESIRESWLHRERTVSKKRQLRVSKLLHWHNLVFQTWHVIVCKVFCCLCLRVMGIFFQWAYCPVQSEVGEQLGAEDFYPHVWGITMIPK